MAVKVRVAYRGSVKSPFDADRTFAFFRDYEKAIPAHFPGLETFSRVPPDAYRWQFEGVSYAGYEFRIELATRFKAEPNRLIAMEPVSGLGNAQLAGRWELSPSGSGTTVTFDASLEADLPVPFFLKSMASSVAQKELAKVFDRYLANVEKALTA